ncbi:hypothetical protein [Collimonas humicola]|uniref:hypothetical protein n=1 Tax=Collimonas humicola TaxID=2825886 RepID=UPI001B8C4292|nr:hypothetical protein [Collimonas humicola]
MQPIAYASRQMATTRKTIHFIQQQYSEFSNFGVAAFSSNAQHFQILASLLSAATLKKESRIFADMYEIGGKDDGNPA